MFQNNIFKWLWKIVFLPSQVIFVAILLFRRTNDLVFDIEMVKSGEQFYIPMIVLKLLFNLKQKKPWSVKVEAVTEAVSVFFKFLVHKLNYRWKLQKDKQRPLYSLCICYLLSRSRQSWSKMLLLKGRNSLVDSPRGYFLDQSALLS